ncbi:MAG: prepilin-type N-terminal cleavage/methylation domain-containing protein [Elusimicrobia bacterium]|nr:prepilin-type N-terminal cleavage/methylation domain-containing protein [Elusimicrobiota bacterium]
MKGSRRGHTLVELVVGMAIMLIVCGAFAMLLRTLVTSTVAVSGGAQGEEQSRQALQRIEDLLSHANQIQVASSTFVQYIVDIDQSPNYDPNALGAGGIPNYRNPDRDGDANQLVAAADQWKVGYNLKDDDEDGDGKIDVEERIYLSGTDLWSDMSVDEAPWGGRYLKRIATDVSTFTLTYFGSKANSLGKNIDLNGDGIVTAAEIDAAVPPVGMGNADGALDTADEMLYVTSVRVRLGLDVNKDGKTDEEVETDVYPPMLPLKAESP